MSSSSSSSRSSTSSSSSSPRSHHHGGVQSSGKAIAKHMRSTQGTESSAKPSHGRDARSTSGSGSSGSGVGGSSAGDDGHERRRGQAQGPHGKRIKQDDDAGSRGREHRDGREAKDRRRASHDDQADVVARATAKSGQDSSNANPVPATNADGDKNAALSGNLMKMKFMQRRQESDLRKRLEQEQRKVVDASHWTLPHDATPLTQQVEFEDSFAGCEDLSATGRRSYQSFNPQVDKLNKETHRQATLNAADEESVTISAAEMSQTMAANQSQRRQLS
ncbi:hypothetical protein CAOG_01928 [Capsaspora owczarzaki ATCC 30864]|nr:hypothetical protein CAOG_01928 [Capsaspora owczarzaki ATCC 30864]|eukprot:XP_004364796.1 hypothetical protein CAOG_01928 [Capsaspora owczarzaki ATCC 30864]